MAALWLGLKIQKLVKDWKSVILGVWVAPGAPKTLAKGGGLRPPTFLKGLQGTPGAPQTAKMADLQSLNKF